MAYPDSVTGGNDPPPHGLLLLWLTTGKAHRGKRPSIHRMMPSWFTGKTHRGRKQPSSMWENPQKIYAWNFWITANYISGV